MHLASLATLYAYGGHLVRAGAVPAGSLFAAVGFTFGLIFATQGVVNTLADAKAAVAALGRVRELVAGAPPDVALSRLLEGERATEATNVRGGDEDPARIRTAEGAVAARIRTAEGAVAARSAAREGDVVFRDVDFSYPSRPDAKVLDGLNLILPRGKVTALVGASGAGKSTVAQLLCRFYEPDAGEIRVGGVPMRHAKFDRADWLDAVALGRTRTDALRGDDWRKRALRARGRRTERARAAHGSGSGGCRARRERARVRA